MSAFLERGDLWGDAGGRPYVAVAHRSPQGGHRGTSVVRGAWGTVGPGRSLAGGRAGRLDAGRWGAGRSSYRERRAVRFTALPFAACARRYALAAVKAVMILSS